ncbi:hypothetical protein RUE5091_04052 [Ruegeria denitrificans]|uniref:Uncharacterized protein n=1 Tax=Ruegeria denitrificans TaxID=1715692 RepID=A0A0P1IRR3_9RHOB|nr:hypothetical protein [Ruegeria denitrificans]CUK16869.1 hypothetical protein RUE5091_04052 [Ruegeria denitrificans]
MEELDKERRRLLQREADVERLNTLHHEAVHSGIKLGPRDRLKAAFHLTRAWKTAKKEGMRKEEFQDTVCARLQRNHSNRREFRLSNWTLRNGEDPATQDLMKKYEKKSTPQKALEPYLVGITVAAEHCGTDPDDWKLAMLRELSLWSRKTRQAGVAPPDDRPSETLAILVKALCSDLGDSNRLGDTFDAIQRMSCEWEMFSDQLVATENSNMESVEELLGYMFGECGEPETMFPFPSVPFLNVPYLFARPEVFHLAPEALLRPLDGDHLASGKYLCPGAGVTGEMGGKRHYNIPEDAPGKKAVSGELYWIREIRLCIVPDGRRGFMGAFESRPRVEVRFDDAHEFGGTHHVIGGYDLALERALPTARADDGGPVFPHIRSRNGDFWRVTIPSNSDGSIKVTDEIERAPSWVFDYDPVCAPGAELSDPFLLSYTPASAPYLRYWLTQDWAVTNVSKRANQLIASCPWAPSHNLATAKFDTVWARNLPPLYELNFPDRSNATWIECCLHNGLIKEALQEKIDLLQEQTSRLQADWHAARERNSNALLRRWKSGSEAKDTQE